MDPIEITLNGNLDWEEFDDVGHYQWFTYLGKLWLIVNDGVWVSAQLVTWQPYEEKVGD